MRLTVFALLLIVLLTKPLLAESEAAPFIYFANFPAHELVIERADGTDRRTMPKLLPGDPNRLTDYGWSPSGQWFVLASNHMHPEFAGAEDIQVVSTNGQRRITLGSYRDEEFRSLWSPTDDTLLTATLDFPRSTVHFQMLDVEHNRLLSEFSFKAGDMIESLGDPELYWSVDNERAYVPWRKSLIVLHRDGRVEQSVPSIGDYAFDFSEGKLFYSRQTNKGIQRLVLEDVNTGRQVQFESRASWPLENYRITWNPERTFALITAATYFACAGPNCEGWLKLVDWDKGIVRTVAPTIIQQAEAGCLATVLRFDQCPNRWSSSGNYFVLIDIQWVPKRRDTVYLLNARTGQTQQISTTGQVENYGWAGKNELYLAYDSQTLYRYQADIGQVESMDFSPQQQYRFFRSFPAVQDNSDAVVELPPTIFDRSVVIRPMQNSNIRRIIRSDLGAEAYRWHPTQPWAIVDYMWNGDDRSTLASVVFKLDGTVQRELPLASGADFLPDRAVPYLAPAQNMLAGH